MSTRPEPRIGDAERERATRALGEHYAAGRLTKEEYDDRSDVALRARTASELHPLFVDLPSAHRQDAQRPETQQASRRPERRPRRPFWQQLPLLPMVAVLATLVAVFSGAWWLLFVFGWMFFCGPRRHRACH